MPASITLRNLTFAYGERPVLNDVSLSVEEGELFGVLGPNGSGKSTLFKLLSGIMLPSSGMFEIQKKIGKVKGGGIARELGVVFQSPALDLNLTIAENLLYHGRFYFLSDKEIRESMHAILKEFEMLDRADDRVVTLSGGLRRRVELAKGMLHNPSVLVLDEPSTGLDPGARLDFWNYVLRMRRSNSRTILLTTHLLEEAERCDRIIILDKGRVVVSGRPADLKSEIGGDVLSIQAHNPEVFAERLRSTFGGNARVVDGIVRLERREGHRFIPTLVEKFPGEVISVTLGKPTLEDVFIKHTGHRFWTEGAGEAKP
jgi:ABC-2 type transport system ATP-binding protein